MASEPKGKQDLIQEYTEAVASELGHQQELFCQEYIKDLNATQAATRAGYSKKTAQEQSSRLLSNVIIKARVDELLAKRSKRLEITADKVLRDIEQVRVRCNQGEPVLDHKGNPTGEWKFEAHAALKASELQGKHIKMFTEKIEHSGSIKTDSLSDEDLDLKIKKLMGSK